MSIRGRGLPEFLIITAIPVALVACSSSSPASSAAGAAAGGTQPAARTQPAAQAAQAQQASSAPAQAAGGDFAFCAALAQVQQDSLRVANGTKKAADVSAEIAQVRQTAPADVKSDVAVMMDVQLAFVNRDPSFAKKYVDPDYLAARKQYYDWAKAHCQAS